MYVSYIPVRVITRDIVIYFNGGQLTGGGGLHNMYVHMIVKGMYVQYT